MALRCRVQFCRDLSYIVLWVIVTLISGVDNSSFTSSSGRISYSILQIARPVENHRLKRTPDEEAIQLPISERKSTVDKLEQILYDNENTGHIFPKENAQGFPFEEYTKIKQNHKQPKYLPSELKNHTSNKIKLETGLFALNESFNEKQKNSFYISKSIIANKKDTKSNLNYSDYLLRTNLSRPNQESLDKPKPSLNLDDIEPVDFAGVNETEEMNDQPVYVASELPFNTTAIVDDDSLEQNLSMHNTSHNSTSADSRTMPAFQEFDIFLICGIILGTFLVLGLIGGSGYVVYRRRIWNKPQTLSDKCSNADSSGYIDDSTLRENSEEMYSLDNDSFLNSLEAMTIQNYWTDNVKHTKL